MSHELPLAGHTALVTGAARGIGREIALRLARAGAKVAVGCHENLEAARAVVAEIERAGGQALVNAGDLADAERAGALADELLRELGPITILVHNAAPPRRSAPLLDTSWQEFDVHYRVGVQAAWQLCRRLVPGMRERGFGRVLLVTTTSVGLYVPGFGAYCAAKAAMETFARYLAVELAKDGITVNVIAPGLVQKDDGVHADAARFPMGKPAHARDVAEAVALLADPRAGALTGVVLPVDGGLSLLEPLRGRRP
jgi:NAD(P)-dependent dehydrogenase (short-subunit alcohol dehydrogenase family)